MNEQPIGRYIAIALIFVLLFVGVAYLAYRFTRPGGTQVAFPTVTPTPTTQPSTGGGTVVLLPPPSQQAINPYIPANRVYFSPQPTVKQVSTGNNGQNALIIQDGKGNILVNNLTHDEYFQLEREKLQTNRDLALAKENNAARLNDAKIQQATAAQQAQANAQQAQQQQAVQSQTAQLSYLTELARLNQQNTTTRLNNQLELARLAQQSQTQQQTNQLELARLGQEFKLEQLRLENDYRITTTQQAYDLATLRNTLYFGQGNNSNNYLYY